MSHKVVGHACIMIDGVGEIHLDITTDQCEPIIDLVQEAINHCLEAIKENFPCQPLTNINPAITLN